VSEAEEVEREAEEVEREAEEVEREAEEVEREAEEVEREAGLWSPEHRALTVGLFLTITFVASEALAIAPALPVVRRDLGGLALYGFVFSGFMLGSLVGTVLAGREADKLGPTPPFVAAVGLFIAGLVVGGLAPSMEVLVLGRVLQGLGAGAVPAIAYTAIGRSLPERLRPRMLAMLSTAWVLPGLFAPAVSAVVLRHFGWRWIFLGLVPFVALAALLALPGLLRLRAVPGAEPALVRWQDAVLAAVGTGLFLGGLTSHHLIGAVPVIAGIAIGLPPLRRLVPPGTLTGRPGLPAAILSRGLLTFLFFGVDVYVPLAVQDVRHRSPALTGLAITAAALLWTAGSWVQAHLSATREPRLLVRTGTALVLVGVAGVSLALRGDVPVAVFVIAWGVGGLGMGLGYGPITLLVLRDAPPGREGATSASLTLFDTLGIAIGSGLAGAVIAASDAAGHSLTSGVAVAFAVAAAAGVLLLFVTPRLAGQRTSSSSTSSRNGIP
jgi:MFS family permease